MCFSYLYDDISQGSGCRAAQVIKPWGPSISLRSPPRKNRPLAGRFQPGSGGVDQAGVARRGQLRTIAE
jgi:hypothetical protein